MGFPHSWELCKVRWCGLTLGRFDQMVSPGSVSEGIPFLPSQLSSHYQGLAKRRDTCPVYKLADFAEEGLNTITFLLAHSSGERKPPQICGLRGMERSSKGRRLLFLPSILEATADDSSE